MEACMQVVLEDGKELLARTENRDEQLLEQASADTFDFFPPRCMLHGMIMFGMWVNFSCLPSASA
jgi:hypothetical protein